MKFPGIAILFFFCSKIIFAQSTAVPNTYALVIGVAKYLDPEIPQLQFANRDAKIFAEFLESKAGGMVPKENIRVLVDEAATSGAINNAIYWLKNICDKNDKVYIYFSGHGDLENITMYNNGFLICYDSPPFNYVNLALSIDYLNDIANTISAQKQAHVIMITDACHSGKLAEKRFKGNFLAVDQLRKIKKNEIRITSSTANQLSNEKSDWGGGRGVFSYYLVYGLKGLAAKGNANKITLDDLKSFLDSSLKNDLVLKKDSTIQIPVVKGNDGSFVLSQVDSASLKAARQEITADTTLQRAMIVSSFIAEESTPEKYLFDLLRKYKMEIITDSFKLNEVSAEDIPFTLIDSLRSQDDTELNKEKLNALKKSLLADKQLLSDFKNNLAAAFDEAGQRVINQYLKGDAAELEKRKYYNSATSSYDVYPRMFRLALSLINPDNKYYYNNLLVKLHYFSGVAARLKLPLAEKKDYKALIEIAFTEQKKALALERYAAYIYNEMGVLYSLKNNTAEAEKYFKIAAARSPNWAIPFSNLANLYIGIRRLDKARFYMDTAKNLQPGFADLYNGYGLIYEKNKNLLQAEEAFHKSIKLNSLNYLPFERLGFLNINTGKYADADSILYEAATRKKGYKFDALRNPRHVKIPKPDNIFGIDAIMDPATISSDNMMGHFALGCQAFRDFKPAVAEMEFRKVIALDPCSPLAYHYLGRTLFEQRRWQEAELIFKQAIANYKQSNEWQQYYSDVFFDSYSKYTISQGTDDFFRTSYYKSDEDTLLLAQLYEQWGHYDEAETYYRGYQQTNLQDLQACVNLAKLFEHTGRFNEVENVLTAFFIKNDEGLPELLEFYERVTNSLPDNGEWFLKAGLLQYAIAQKNPDEHQNDVKAIDPFSGKIEYASQPRYEIKIPVPALPRIIPYGTVIPVIKRKPIFKPFTNGIYYLKKAMAIPPFEEMQLADINVKIGNLYAWQGLPDSAASFFETALELNPDDAGTRNKLTVTYANDYRFTEALVQLDSLLKRKQLNLEKQLMLARFKLQDGDLDEARKLIQQADLINPGFSLELTLLKAQLAIKAGNIKEAITNYKILLEINRKDSIQLYNIAGLYALAGNKKEALDWLQLALNAGFNYKYVLQYDPVYRALKKDTRWLAVFKNCTGKEYLENDFSKWDEMLSNLDEYTPLFVQ